MTAETKQLFDHRGCYEANGKWRLQLNVYDEKQESFQWEAEGYEKLAQAKGQGKSIEQMQPKPDSDEDFLPSGSTTPAEGHSMPNADVASSNLDNSASKSDNAFDMFGEDDKSTQANPSSNGEDLVDSIADWSAMATGHPLVATGARCVATPLHEMKRRGKDSRFGVVSMCIDSGMRAAAVFERGNSCDEHARKIESHNFYTEDTLR